MPAQGCLGIDDHLSLTADALLTFGQKSLDGGSSIAFGLLHGWARGYVETSGYLIPTCLDIARAINRPDMRDHALALGEWVLSHQRPDGAFPDITRTHAAAFDTSQVLMGLQRLFEETGDERFLAAGRRACDYLCGLSDPDGSWSRSGDAPGVSKTYFTRSAAALLAFGRLVEDARYIDTATRFLEWAITQRLPSGLFRNSELPPFRGYLLHTIIYVLEGFLLAYEVTGDRRWLEATLSGAEPLKAVNLNREITLYSLYSAELTPLTQEKCVTGLAQWAGLCLGLYKATGDADYRECASNTLYYVKSKQLRRKTQLRGALPGSVPVWGVYLKLSFPNWNLKFFGDALLKWKAMGLDDADQQERFVMRSHHIYADKVGWATANTELSAFDRDILSAISKIAARQLPAGSRPTVVDLGCGAGRCLDYFETLRPDWTFLGVDPLPGPPGARAILTGTANSIPLADESADVIYACISLQHVDAIDAALAEVRRVLRKGGLFVLFDRNPLSLRGLLKPWHELRGRWIYSWDAPFRERWYSPGRWKALFRAARLKVIGARTFTDRSGSGLRRLMPINRFLLVSGRKV